MFDADYDAAFADVDTFDECPEAVVLYAFGAIAIVMIGMVACLGFFI